MNIQSQWLELQGLRIHYRTAGETGSPIVLLHGGGADSSFLSWELLIPLLAQTHRVFAADWPGYGLSDKPRLAYTMDYYIQCLEALLDSWGLQTTRLVGLSMGGGIGLGFTLKAPRRVDKLVLLDSYGLQAKAAYHRLSYLLIKMAWLNQLSWKMMCSSRSMIRYSMKLMMVNPQALTAPLLDALMEEVNRPNATRAWNTMQEDEIQWNGVKTCYMQRLGEIAAPTLIIHGEKDTAVPLDCSKEAHTHIPNSRLEIISGAGHWPQRDRPEIVNPLVEAFLKD